MELGFKGRVTPEESIGASIYLSWRAGGGNEEKQRL